MTDWTKPEAYMNREYHCMRLRAYLEILAPGRYISIMSPDGKTMYHKGGKE